MIVVSGTAQISPESLETLRPMMEKTILETRKETGCIAYHYGIDVINPDLMVIVEHWENWEALEAHFKTPHIAAWMEALRKSGAVVSDVRFLEAGEERNPFG